MTLTDKQLAKFGAGVPKKGDYVLATKWSDGDPGDHWCVGWYDRGERGRHYVLDGKGNQFRGNGFRVARKITPDIGSWLLGQAKELEREPAGSVNLWDLVYMAVKGGSDG